MFKYKSINFFFFFVFLYDIIMEPSTSNNNINAIKEVRKLFNEHKSNFSHEEIKEIKEKLHKKEVVYN